MDPLLLIAIAATATALLFLFLWLNQRGQNKKLSRDLDQQIKAIEDRLALADKYSKMLATVADKTFEAVIITNKDGIIEWVNDGFYKITGYTLPEVKGKKPGQILQGPKTDQNTVARIREHLKKKVLFKEEILNYHKQGYEYWLSLSITPVLDAKGEVEKFIAIESDITKQKREREELELRLRSLSK